MRYSQLKKVQDVLVQDLEHCVSRRDAMMTTAVAREKRSKGGMEKTRINFNRKMDDMRNKAKQMENVRVFYLLNVLPTKPVFVAN